MLTAAGVVTMNGESVQLLAASAKPASSANDYEQLARKVLDYVDTHKKITRREVMVLCQLSGPEAYRVLQKLVSSGHLHREGGAKLLFTHAMYNLYTRA